jgi:phage shock protein A
MKKKLLLILAAAVMMVPLGLTGCGEGGIAEELYDQIREQLEQLQDQLAQVQEQFTLLQEENESIEQAKEAAEAALAEAEVEITALEEQLDVLEEQLDAYVLVGATAAETAERIARFYANTHYYEENIFDCTDMSDDVWNMLKAQGISARLVVGNPNVPAFDDITLSNHSWVMAEVAPGEYLAVEAVGGYTVSRQSNGGYYRGWTFNNPAELNRYYELITEYNVRVEMRNRLEVEANAALGQGNNSLYSKLVELRTEQETELNNIRAQYEALATKL